MDIKKKHIIASLFGSSRLNQALPVKAKASFLTKLSERCPALFHVNVYDVDEDTMLGYESSWAGVSKPLTGSCRDSIRNFTVVPGDFTTLNKNSS